MILPEGFALPPFAYLVTLAVFCAVIGLILVSLDPPVTKATVVALAPWMAVGGGLHVLLVIDAAPPAVAPLLGTPAVYLTTFVLAGFVWVVAAFLASGRGSFRPVPRRLGAVGLVCLALVLAAVLVVGAQRGSLEILWPLIAFVASVVVAGLAWLLLSLRYTTVAATTGTVGALVVFGHVLDGVTTAIGIDVLGAGERSPLPRLIMDAAAMLPTADVIGVGWLFVLVKVALALLVVGLFAEYVRERPARGYLLLGLVAAVGLGPGVHNLLLFTVG